MPVIHVVRLYGRPTADYTTADFYTLDVAMVYIAEHMQISPGVHKAELWIGDVCQFTLIVH